MTLPILVLFGLAIVFGVLLGLFLFQCINKNKTKVDKDCINDMEQQFDDAFDSLNVTIREVSSETIVLGCGLDERGEQLKRLRLQPKSSLGFFKPEDEVDVNFTKSSFAELDASMLESLSNYPEFSTQDQTLRYLVDFNLRYRAHHALVAELVAAYFKKIDELLGNLTISTQESNTQFTV